MNSADNSSASVSSTATATPVVAVPQINAFNWLLVLGFPAEVAAAVVRPDTFAR
ncbi:MAG: hypothetical protein HYV96_18310 [Opitutae bacterium]|nr:hypothetical protein [Opitutae bacterium]